jgi:hypothetical protein
MSFYAAVGGQRTRATRDGERRGLCLDCDTTMIAKTGDVLIWHWAHESIPDDCALATEGEWHRSWKALALDGTQEVVVGNRRADVLAPGGYAVEFQSSPLTQEEVEEREHDWAEKLVWVFDAREAYDNDRLRLLGEPYDKRKGLFWFKAPERIKGAMCPTYYDIGNDTLIRVARLRLTGASIKGVGFVMAQKAFVTKVLQGRTCPMPPVWTS